MDSKLRLVDPCIKGVLVIVHAWLCLCSNLRMVGWGLSHVCLTSWNWPCAIGFIESCGFCVTECSLTCQPWLHTYIVTVLKSDADNIQQKHSTNCYKIIRILYMLLLYTRCWGAMSFASYHYDMLRARSVQDKDDFSMHSLLADGSLTS